MKCANRACVEDAVWLWRYGPPGGVRRLVGLCVICAPLIETVQPGTLERVELVSVAQRLALA